MKDLHKKISIKKVISALAILLVVLIIFQAGIFVGYKKASFSGKLGEGYNRAFEKKDGRMPFVGLFDKDLPGGHGATGKIVKIELPNIVIASLDNVEKTIKITDDTIIREFRDAIKAQDLKIDDFVVVIGTPNDDGVIDARLVRLMPPPPTNIQSTSTITSSTTTNQ